MSDDKSAKPSWLAQGKKKAYSGNVLYFPANSNYTVRIVDDTPPTEIWKHSARTPDGAFVNVLCTNTFANQTLCPLCAVNSKQLDRPPQKRKYAKSSEWAKVVWVYQENAFKIVRGYKIWQSIDVIYGQGVNIFNRDFSIVRKDEKGQTNYTVVQLDPTEFTAAPDLSAAPKVEEYVDFLRNNINRIVVTDAEDEPVGEQPATEPPAQKAPSILGGGSQQTASAPAPAAEAPAAPKEDQAVREQLMARFRKVLSIGTNFDPTAITKALKVVNDARKAMNANAELASDTDSLTNAEFEQYINIYEAEITNNPKK